MTLPFFTDTSHGFFVDASINVHFLTPYVLVLMRNSFFVLYLVFQHVKLLFARNML